MIYENMTVAVVDPDRDSLIAVSEAFSRVSPCDSVRLFSTSSEAAEFIKSNRVDMLITETAMPSPDGFELAMLLQREQPEAKLVFMSAAQTDAVEAMQLHADDYLEKPITDAELIHAINEK